MRRVFADAGYWVALAAPRDQLHARAVRAGQSLQGIELVTTEEVLTEFLDFFSERGQSMREGAVRFVEGILADPGILVRPQAHDAFVAGFALYKGRPDKGYSQTDCVSMQTMRRESLTEALTDDDHFAQEGFVKLL